MHGFTQTMAQFGRCWVPQTHASVMLISVTLSIAQLVCRHLIVMSKEQLQRR